MAAGIRNVPATGTARDAEGAPQRGLRGPLIVAGVCAAALGVLGLLAAYAGPVRTLDIDLLRDFIRLRSSADENVLSAINDIGNAKPYVVWIAAIVAAALLQRKPWLAFTLAAAMLAAPLSADRLKAAINMQHIQIGTLGVETGSWPSGHSAAVAAFALCAVLVTPTRFRRPVAAVGGAVVIAVALALQILEQHMLTDILGGWLLALMWVSLAVAVTRWVQARGGADQGV